MTVEDWLALDEDEPGELVDGALEEEEMPSIVHEVVTAFLLRVLGAWVMTGGGVALGSELKLVVGARKGRKADVSVYFPGSPLPGGRRSGTRRPPDLVVEVLSPRPRDTRRDTVEKPVDYAAFGVRFYWLVDPVARTVEVRELVRDAPHRILLAAAEGSHAVPGCQGLVLDLDALWREVDRFADDEDEPEP